MGDKNVSIEEALAKLKKLDSEDFYFINAKLNCPHCERAFGIDKEYMGVVICPYCGKYIEGM